MILHPVGGLCNRLRAILSYWAHQQAKGEPLDIVWDADEYVSGADWGEVFEALPNVRFGSGAFDVESFGVCPDAPLSWVQSYRWLKPHARLTGRILSLQRMLGPGYAAIHVRRTDHSPLAMQFDRYTKDQAFAEWLRGLSPSRRIYVATDNAETQKRWLGFDPDRTVCAEQLFGSSETQRGDNHRRHTSLAHAVVDLFVCAGASEFMGSGLSSFSETIEVQRWLGGKRETMPALGSAA